MKKNMYIKLWNNVTALKYRSILGVTPWMLVKMSTVEYSSTLKTEAVCSSETSVYMNIAGMRRLTGHLTFTIVRPSDLKTATLILTIQCRTRCMHGSLIILTL